MIIKNKLNFYCPPEKIYVILEKENTLEHSNKCNSNSDVNSEIFALVRGLIFD